MKLEEKIVSTENYFSHIESRRHQSNAKPHLFFYFYLLKNLNGLFIQSIYLVMIINAKDIPAMVADWFQASYSKFKRDHAKGLRFESPSGHVMIMIKKFEQNFISPARLTQGESILSFRSITLQAWAKKDLYKTCLV